MAEAAVQLPYLSAHYEVPESTLSSLTQAPTVDLVDQLLRSITQKAHAFDELNSDKLRLEVEHENAVRSHESKSKVLKNTIEKRDAELQEARKQLQESENKRSALESEISSYKSSSTSNESETSSLKSRIASLETSNRDTLALLESKSAAHDSLAEELSAQHKKTIELRRELSTAEQNLQNSNSASASARFREQNLQQELDLTKKNNEWFETELKTKNSEHIKFRKEKNTRITELQRENEEANTVIDSLRRSENSLRSRLDETEQRYEESLAKNHQLQEEAIQAAESFRNELEASSRLADLQGSAAKTAKERVHECQLALEKAKDDAAQEISRVRVEMQTETADKVAAEQRIAELEQTIAQLESDSSRHRSMSPARSINGMAPSTPMRHIPGTPGSTFSPRASRTKGGLTMTQLYTEYDKMRSKLEAECRKSKELEDTLDEMAQDVEASKPEIDSIREENTRYKEAVMEMSDALDVALKDRDEASQEARKWQGQVEGLVREGDILRQQLRDLSAEVKVLVLEVFAAKQGEACDREELQKMILKEIEGNAEGLTPTGRFISRNLTTFKDLDQLQEQNLNLRRMVRELGERMEGEEARAKDSAREKEVEELKELRVKSQASLDEIAHLKLKISSYMKERDTFRSMLAHRGQNVGESTSFSQSVPPGGVPLGSLGRDQSDYAELLRQLQAHFDSFREEAATDYSALRQQLNDLSRKNSELLSEISRSNSQHAAASQRAELLQRNFDMLKVENSEVQKRNALLSEDANRLQIRTQQAAEDLVETKGLVESLQRESANLKAEKDLWKNIERRLIDDVENLRNERSRVDSLNADLQRILNEREQTDSESRRRLQSSVETLESELQIHKRKLNEELEDSKKANMRREYEHEQSQKRIDDLVASLGSVREELVATKTTKDHLQSRVDELSVELKSAEERLQVLQSRPNVSMTPAETTAVSQDTGDGSGLSREQELAIEVSELKRDLDLAKADHLRMSERIEQYQAISQSTEEAMTSESETHALYREETDRLLEERSKKIQDLEARVEEISAELSATNTELSKLRDEQGEATRHLDEQKANFESEITRLKDDIERHVAAAQFHQEDLKAQAEIAQNAQQNYETELVKHAEAAKNHQTARAEVNQLRLDITEVRTQSETYKKDLAQKEESWAEQKARYETELTDMHKRREEIQRQNSLLHSQLENISTQISSLQRDRVHVSDNEEQEGEQSASNLEGLQEVIKYLRREKEIVEVQYHLSTQEGKRLRQQLDHTQLQLDDTRLKLEQHRRAAADSEHNALNHNKLMETLNELNVFRESNVTLRNQSKQSETALAEKSARVDELHQQIEPLETKIRELENNLEAKDGEMHLLQADRDRYQQRVQNILQKYDRVDPAEMESLKEKLASFEKERDQAVAARDELQAQTATHDEQLKNAENRVTELRTKLTEQFKARSKELSGRISSKQNELTVALQEKDVIQQELQTTKAELESLKAQAAAGVSTTVVESTSPAAPTSEEDAPVNPTPASQFPTATTQVVGSGDEQLVKDLEAKIARLEAALAEKDAVLATKDAELNAKIKEQTDKLKEIYNSKMAEAKAAHRQELENLSSGEQAAPATPAATSTDQPPTAPSQTTEFSSLTDAQARELVNKNETVKTIVRNNIRTMVNKEREKLKQEQATADTKVTEEREALQKAHETETAEKVKSAVELTDKKYAARISINENRFKTAQAKIDVVQKAAEETPQKPVVEVWAVAKIARPAPMAPQPPKPLPATSPAQPASPAPAAVQVTPAPEAAANAPPAVPSPAPAVTDATVVQPVEAAPSAAPAQPQAAPQPPTQGGAPPNPFGPAPSSDEQKEQPSTLPTKPPTTTPPGMLRALQSGLPIARGGRGGRGGGGQQHADHQQAQAQNQASGQRGSNLARGRGGRGGQGRGGNQNVQAPGQPTPAANRGALNVQARQFIPQGNKRSREDGSDATADSGSGKRIRGGGQSRGASS
ncbi:hypothetical protein N7492_009073 [Penicillium capsulatum]|uniref:Nucleoprotein TPR/MLP1 domain-containing protein n=1 Tax=Penicillium capsulatum TaxID=69766 RepID=A0A9W9HU69_9EURO|nr:hypothetical protein N7492_009073 [Penicillium capsulatum]KAJ6106472.1 hypothetical protein N7512_009989 [Penicillium capsulatum]